MHCKSPGDVSTDFVSPLTLEPIPELDERAAGDTEETDEVVVGTGGRGLRFVELFSTTVCNLEAGLEALLQGPQTFLPTGKLIKIELPSLTETRNEGTFQSTTEITVALPSIFTRKFQLNYHS